MGLDDHLLFESGSWDVGYRLLGRIQTPFLHEFVEVVGTPVGQDLEHVFILHYKLHSFGRRLDLGIGILAEDFIQLS